MGNSLAVDKMLCRRSTKWISTTHLQKSVTEVEEMTFDQNEKITTQASPSKGGKQSKKMRNKERKRILNLQE